jgi:hypothetical protein
MARLKRVMIFAGLATTRVDDARSGPGGDDVLAWRFSASS